MSVAVAELSKVGAFIRRDFLIALSYKTAFAGDILQILVNGVLFALIGKLIVPGALPSYGGTRATYLEFVVIGSTLALVTGLLLQRVATAIRTEQMIGTLEALLTTPTRIVTVQAGSVAYDALLVPIRVMVFLAVVSVVFGLDLHGSGVLPSFVILLGFVPFVWGLGLLSAGAMVTFRRGGGAIGLAATGLGLMSGVYFPLSVLPQWIETIVRYNPLAIAIDATREALIGGTGLAALGSDMLIMVPLSALSLAVGSLAFDAAVRRERRRGTLGEY